MIRPAAAADVSELELLWKRYRIEVADDREPDVAAWQTWIRRRIAAGDARVGVVERKIVAYTVWQRVRAKNDHARRDLRIIELYVDPSGRGQRTGSGLLARAIDAARQRDCHSVELVSNVHDERVRGLAIPFGFALSGDSLVLLLQQA